MIIETTYSPEYLVRGICKSCGEVSSEIDPISGMCIDCIKEERFYRESLKPYNRSSEWM